MTPAVNEHVGWLVAAVRTRAKRHDSFEIERHFAVSADQAVELGGTLHEIAAGACALAVVSAITESPDGTVVVRYRAVDGTQKRLEATTAEDGRLSPPTFH